MIAPEIHVVGITIVCGNSPVEMGFANAKKVLRHMNRLDVPVYAGEAKPLKRDYVNALDTHGSDCLGESFLPEVECALPSESAVDFRNQPLLQRAEYPDRWFRSRKCQLRLATDVNHFA